jgi:hypothetical protein
MRHLTILFLMVSGIATAQNSPTDSTTTEPQRLLIVPFEDKLFFTDVMQELAEGSGLSPEEVVNTLRNMLQLSVRQVLQDSIEVGSFLSADSLPPDGLTRIFGGLGYDYIALYGEKKDVKQRSGVERGQVRATRDTTTRYMAASLKDAAVLRDFRASHGFTRFLFLTQLEVRMDLTNPEEAMMRGLRTVAVHYTLTDADGAALRGGIVRYDLEDGAEINRIRNEAFPVIANQLFGVVFPKKKEEKPKR